MDGGDEGDSEDEELPFEESGKGTFKALNEYHANALYSALLHSRL